MAFSHSMQVGLNAHAHVTACSQQFCLHACLLAFLEGAMPRLFSSHIDWFLLSMIYWRTDITIFFLFVCLSKYIL